ncbi:VOC family protein [Litoribacillus peritrichatus]|uniref:VOC family protein n=1 Tax=Litoribacillus peritrichatus TaxID=718191 RepID=A0ABP7MTH1_9GAMM
MTPNMTHLALHVADCDICAQFYLVYCGMKVIHRRQKRGKQVVWLAEPNREQEFVLVLLDGGPYHQQADLDFSHLGFAVATKEEVDRIAELARNNGDLVWEPRQEPYPVGYYCGLKDPNGNMVEFSYGQPLGPGSEGQS